MGRSREGADIDDLRLANLREPLAKVEDLWKPLLAKRGRVELEKYFAAAPQG